MVSILEPPPPPPPSEEPEDNNEENPVPSSPAESKEADLITKIIQSDRDVRYVTLHVNQGTFAPLTEEHWREKKLHEEWYEIDPETAKFLNDAKKKGRPIIAVGTTTVRTLESAASVRHSCHTECFLPNGSKKCTEVTNGTRHDIALLERLSGTTDIFITENDRPRFVDGLVTNFHVPRSSLLMLVSAFTGRATLLDLYRQAMEKEFRFFSFGDGMLIM